jgi:hypothetical protein
MMGGRMIELQDHHSAFHHSANSSRCTGFRIRNTKHPQIGMASIWPPGSSTTGTMLPWRRSRRDGCTCWRSFFALDSLSGKNCASHVTPRPFPVCRGWRTSLRRFESNRPPMRTLKPRLPAAMRTTAKTAPTGSVASTELDSAAAGRARDESEAAVRTSPSSLPGGVAASPTRRPSFY